MRTFENGITFAIDSLLPLVSCQSAAFGCTRIENHPARSVSIPPSKTPPLPHPPRTIMHRPSTPRRSIPSSPSSQWSIEPHSIPCVPASGAIIRSLIPIIPSLVFAFTVARGVSPTLAITHPVTISIVSALTVAFAVAVIASAAVAVVCGGCGGGMCAAVTAVFVVEG